MTRPFACRIDKYHLHTLDRSSWSPLLPRIWVHRNPFANCAQAFFNSHFLRSCKICDEGLNQRMFKTLTHVWLWLGSHDRRNNSESFFKWLLNWTESRWDTRWGIGDNSLKLPHCVPTILAYLHTYFENWSLMTQTFFFHCIYQLYHLTLVIYGSFLWVTQWQMHVTLQRRLRDLICEKDF